MTDRRFEDMTDPPLVDRVRAFEQWLEAEPCLNDGACIVMSVSRRMCPPCRLRLSFRHCTYYAEAYEGGPGEIQFPQPLMQEIGRSADPPLPRRAL